MPTIEENRAWWGGGYQWPQDGDEWSTGAGGTLYVWHGTIMPRLCAFLPARHILEIAPGRGRFTQQLLSLGPRFPKPFRVTGVDVTEACIRHCEQRFRRQRLLGRARFHINDGRALPMLADASVDLAFSWDSLVHVERDVMESYIHELGRVLRPGGAAILHHSNRGNFPPPAPTDRPVTYGWRGITMTWQLFREFCDAAGVWCLAQELRTFKQPQLIDCISVLCRPPAGAAARPEPVLFENDEFFRETQNLSRIAHMYRPPGS